MRARRPIKKRELDWDDHWLLIRLPRRVGQRLVQDQPIPRDRRLNLGRPGRCIPAPKLAEVLPACIFHRADEIFTGRSSAVMPIKIEVAAFSKGGLAQHCVEHADNLRALIVDGGRIEI